MKYLGYETRLAVNDHYGGCMKKLLSMSIILAGGTCFAWSQAPANSQSASNSNNRAAPRVRIAHVPINQLPPDSGKEMYTAYCAPCHGVNAKGSGMAASALQTSVPDLTQLSVQNQGRYPAHHVVIALSQFNGSHAVGTSEMPDWYKAFRSIDRSCPYQTHLRALSIARYLETLQIRQ